MNFDLVKNYELNGIELYFESKPSREVLDYLKQNGFRWHNMKKCWYAKERETTLKVVENLKSGVSLDTPAETKTMNIHGVKVGDIFWMCWGYGQTNNNFFQVVELRGTQMVKVREIHKEMVEGKSDGPFTCYVKPVKDSFETRSQFCAKDGMFGENEGVYKKVKKSGDLVYLSMTSFANATLVKDLNRDYYESWGY